MNLDMTCNVERAECRKRAPRLVIREVYPDRSYQRSDGCKGPYDIDPTIAVWPRTEPTGGCGDHEPVRSLQLLDEGCPVEDPAIMATYEISGE